LVDRGVPQGSILGPLLFLCYINDLPRIFENDVKPVLFADDTSLIINSHSLLQHKNDVNIAFVRLNEWFNANLLTLNFDKTKHVQLSTRSTLNNVVSVSYNNNFISNNTNTKFLGLVLESSCIWKAHIFQLCLN
jgi:hypothetical protein